MDDLFENNTPQLVVWDQQSFLKRLMGDEELAQKLLNRYVQTINDELDILLKAINSNDNDSILHTAHKIHGSSNSVGALKAGYTASIIEKQARTDSIGDISGLVKKLIDEVSEFKSVVEL